jgi:hypothetical protein
VFQTWPDAYAESAPPPIKWRQWKGFAIQVTLAIVCLFGSLCVQAKADCVVEPAALVPLDVIDNTILVTAKVNDRNATFILDTGTSRSLVTEAAVAHLGLSRDSWVSTAMQGIGGIERRANADPRSFTLGGLPLVRPTLNHDTSLTVGVMPGILVGNRTVDGLLGRDFLSAFDLDLDIPRRQLTLYRVSGCKTRVIPWQFPFETVPVAMPIDRAVVVAVNLDGVPLRALLDTGASESVLAAPGIVRTGISPAQLAADQGISATGVGRRSVLLRRHTFQMLRVAGTHWDTPMLLVSAVHLYPIVDMMLAVDWLAQHRVWLSFSMSQLGIAEN